MNIARVQKIHSAFKNLCESFTINFTEYSQLLGETEASFAVWDSDANGI
ncbi:MAG: hypothetical protein P4M11_13000 [Candidatus Pacebacteria bacterium]|nr:hypothetical protein [Candidatus Paceibacterota bacterium]